LKRSCSYEIEEDDGMTRFIALLAILVGVTACGNSPGDRALTGGAIGAGTGAVIGSTTVVGTVPGAVVGGVVGAGVGVVTTPVAWIM
jgi:osmotically inducible lipoprotein OsmB